MSPSPWRRSARPLIRVNVVRPPERREVPAEVQFEVAPKAVVEPRGRLYEAADAAFAIPGIARRRSLPFLPVLPKPLPGELNQAASCTLNDLVFQRGNPWWSLPSTRFRYPDSSRRFRMICPAMDSSVEVAQPLLQSVPIFLPRDAIHPGRRLPFQAVAAAPEQFDISRSSSLLR